LELVALLLAHLSLHYSIFGELMTEWSYVLLERNEEGIVVDSHDVTGEVVFLYTMIEKQERIIQSYRKDLGFSFLDDAPSLLRH
jgi:hypothetical protein